VEASDVDPAGGAPSEPQLYALDVEIGPPNAHTFTLEMVGAERDVLELGCGAGAMTRAMAGIGCKVVGVEMDPVAAEHARPHADQVVVGDLVTLDLAAELGEGRFDVLVFGDVLEHLPDPLAALRTTRSLLRPGGHIVLSVPNVAHGDVRLALLAGRFPYADLGLLDSTHLRFFTWDTLRTLLRDAGFVAVEVRRAQLPLFGTEIELDPAAYDPAVVEQVRNDDESTTYQFVVRAVPADEHEELRALVERAEAAEADARTLRAEQAQATRQLDEALDEVGRLRVSEADARLRMDILTDRIRDLESAVDTVTMLRASKIVKWTAPPRRLARRVRRKIQPPPPGPHT
jgi:2-polyprenyl-3-methyl-5-hydroxy-6-metoxy-1,4-benzoquinol methylase